MFLERDDARCLCWAVACGTDSEEELKRSADMGYAWAQVLLANLLSPSDVELVLLEKAAAHGEATAFFWLAHRLWDSEERTEDDKKRAKILWRQAGLGDGDSQLEVAERCSVSGSPEQLAWLRHSALQDNPFALQLATAFLPGEVCKYDDGCSGRALHEIAIALDSLPEWRNGESPEMVAAGERALELLNQWHGEAKRAVTCWIWLARQEGTPKDIRLLIADLIWDERAAWSERNGTRLIADKN